MPNEDNALWLKSPVSAKAEQLRGTPEIYVEPYEGRRRKVKLFRTSYVIGSDPKCDIRINDPFVSGAHAEIFIPGEGQGFYLRDRDSRNGVFLNGVKVQSAPLPKRGNLRIGRSSIVWPPPGLVDLSEMGGYIAEDPVMQEILGKLRTISLSPLSVLLLGETGTGKDELARLVHQWSAREKGPYVAVNGALTDGNLAESTLFGHKKGAYTGAESARLGALRSAHQGSLFLDEVADIPGAAQAKLLRALESKEVQALGSDDIERSDFRLISATSQDIDRKVEDGSFRLDLYFRIAGHIVMVPPLRDRPADISAMAARWAESAGLSLDREAEGILLSYGWPGNVRELKAVIEKAQVIASSEGTAWILPRHLTGLCRIRNTSTRKDSRPQTLLQNERDCILESLERNGWSRTIVSSELGIARSTLAAKMKRLKIRDLVDNR
jgi:sigma-54-dependent transcriptional regulator